jgi:hypothetical protein
MRLKLHDSALSPRSTGDITKLALWLFPFLVLAHWAEHLAQALRIRVLDWTKPEVRGALGVPFSWLVSFEWMYCAYAIVMPIGLCCRGRRFQVVREHGGRWHLARSFWYHIEHLLLFVQAMAGYDVAAPTVPSARR